MDAPATSASAGVGGPLARSTAHPTRRWVYADYLAAGHFAWLIRPVLAGTAQAVTKICVLRKNAP